MTRPGARQILVIAVMDLAIALVLAVLVFRIFGAASQVDTNPPVCYSTSGNQVSCSLTAPVLMIPTFVVVLAALAAWQLRRLRVGD